MDAKKKNSMLHFTAGRTDVEAERQGHLANDHLLAALKALLSLVEAHPRLAALMATRPAQAPLLSCLGPVCRYAVWSYW